MDFRSPQDVLSRVVETTQRRVNERKGLVDGAPGSLRILFYYSTLVEFLDQVGRLPEDSKYPFLFVNSVRARMAQTLPSGWVWELPDIVLAAKSKEEWTRMQRDEYNFDPILTPVLSELTAVMNIHGGMEVVTRGTVSPGYFYGAPGADGYTAHRFNQPIDVYQIRNMTIRITKNCR